MATGPSVGAVGLAGFGWRAAFFVNLPVGLVAWTVGRQVLEGRVPTVPSATPDYLGVVLPGGGLSALVLTISHSPSRGWTSPAFLASTTAALVLGNILFRTGVGGYSILLAALAMTLVPW